MRQLQKIITETESDIKFQKEKIKWTELQFQEEKTKDRPDYHVLFAKDKIIAEAEGQIAAFSKIMQKIKKVLNGLQ